MEFLFKSKNNEVISVNLHSIDKESYGAKVWNCSKLFGEYLVSEEEFYTQKNILELGSGLGLIGILLAKLGNIVWCTDRIDDKDILNILKTNIFNNNLPLTWGIEIKEYTSIYRNLDIAIGCDIIYDNKDFDFIIHTLLSIFESNPRLEFFLISEIRTESTSFMHHLSRNGFKYAEIRKWVYEYKSYILYLITTH